MNVSSLKVLKLDTGFLLLSLIFFLLVFSGCKKRPAIADKLFEHYKNEVYKEYDTTAYFAEFRRQMNHLKPGVENTKIIKKFYKKQGLEPHFVDQFLLNGQLNILVEYLNKAAEDGLDPQLFHPDKIARDLELFNHNGFKTIDEIYPAMARLELETANSLISYSRIMRYGLVNPQNLYRRYSMPISRPDSIFNDKVFNTTDLGVWLGQLQPTNKVYKQLKRALADSSQGVADSIKKARILAIKLNMERLRWQIPPKEKRYLWVNIPAFTLQCIDNDTIALQMRVCVGQPKTADYDALLQKYLETKNIDDKPLNHETTILSSRINVIQLNPTWNIPNSIAQNEIYYSVLKSPSYLANKNIKVYLNGKRVDPDQIKWANIKREKMQYKFVQDASDLNALGKFKFIFDNESSIYLHDTPEKKAFTKAMRAVSHGCVRVEDPLALTQLLIADTNRVDAIRMEVGLEPKNQKNIEKYNALLLKRGAKGFELKSKYIDLKQDMQLFIDYYTCLPDAEGNLQFYPDIYRRDGILSNAIGKYFSK